MENENEYYKLSKQEYHAGNFKKALLYIEINIKLYPYDYLSYLLKGNIETLLSEYEKSIISYEKGIKIKPNNAKLHNDLSFSLSKINKYNTAILESDRAIHLNPFYEDAYFNKGLF